MGLIVCMILGIVTGWLVGAIQEVDEGMFARMGIGMLGGIIGNLVAGLISKSALSSMINITWLNAVLSIVGAFVFLGVAQKASLNDSRDGA